MVEKEFKVGIAVLIQYRRVTDRQPASHFAVASTALTYTSRVTRNSAVADKPRDAFVWLTLKRAPPQSPYM